MCRPPDIVPQAPDFRGVDAAGGRNYELMAAAAARLARNGSGIPATGMPVFAPSAMNAQANGSLLPSSLPSLKRSIAACGGPFQSVPFQGPPKVPRPSVTTEFDDAASSFIARMEESVIADIKQKQQQMLLDKYIAQAQQQLPPRAPTPASAAMGAPAPSPALNAWLRGNGMAGFPGAAGASAAPMLGAPVTGLPAASMFAGAPSLAVSGIPTGLPQFAPPPHAFVPGADDEGHESEEKKVKRIMSNRASAKRSRQRRQERLEELERETEILHEDHAAVVSKLSQATAQLQRMQAENGRLEAELKALRQAAEGAGVVLPPAGDAPAAAGAAAVEVVVVKEEGEEINAVKAAGAAQEKAKPAAIFEGLLPEEKVEEEGRESGLTGDWSETEQEQPPQEQEQLFLDGLDCNALGSMVDDDLFANLLSCFDGVA
eukprot:TRINITY_DN24228_c0_g1_i2.p1 TRINITY_DN24228_c0_g1~~TRINITY_DN24228_c0_g1_i2.p1  ORF type:complete len:431 (+),score=35.00 TRINITY_DN24228_c0_g1_i2:175-1467(+)